MSKRYVLLPLLAAIVVCSGCIQIRETIWLVRSGAVTAMHCRPLTRARRAQSLEVAVDVDWKVMVLVVIEVETWA